MGDVSDGPLTGTNFSADPASDGCLTGEGGGGHFSRACSGRSRSKYNPVDPLQTITVEISKNWPSKIPPKTLNFNYFKLEHERGI